MRDLELRAAVETWPRKKPLRISGYTFEVLRVIVVSLMKDGKVGRGEAAGIYYLNQTPESMLKQLEDLRPAIEAECDRESLQTLLPAGGVRNALDCALWDLEAQLRGRAVWQIAGLQEPRPLLTTFTCSAESPENMAATARSFVNARAIKLKLTGEPIDADRVRAVREATPQAWLSVDANQGFTRSFLEHLLPVLVANEVALIEQPFRIGEEALLEGFRSPIPVVADESVQGLSSLPSLVGRFDMANIKLDKCGGLTEGLMMARELRTLGLDVMVGCMGGTSLAMAPAYVLGQLCDVVDLDGPAFIRMDRDNAVRYLGGLIECPPGLWGIP
jgi:L-alanine-DL-glutamate epimerase-like enolase superfamily enzyme